MFLTLLTLVLFVGCYFSFSLLKKCYLNKKGQLLSADFDFFSGAFLYFWVFVGLLATSFFIPGLVSFRLLAMGLCLSLMVLYLSGKILGRKSKYIFKFLLSLLGVILVFPDNFTSSIMAFSFLFLGTFFWLFAWRVFDYFDRFPLCSFLIVSSWMIAIFLGGQMIFKLPLMIVLTFSVGLVDLICVKRRLQYGQMDLAEPLASLMGYFWAGVWSFFFLRGHVFPALGAYSYYLFELGIMLFAYLKRQEIQPLIAQILIQPSLRNKSLKILFVHMLFLMVTCVMGLGLPVSLLLGIIVLVFVHLKMSLTHLVHPAPTYKELFSDLKKGLKETYSHTKKIVQKKKLEKVIQTPQKKKSTLKKPLKTKGKKKK